MHSKENTSIKEGGKLKPCLNCETTLVGGASHCYNCGQAIKEAKMTVRALFSELFTNLFNLDGKIWKTLKQMWTPAYLTKEYVSGRRQTYFNPARFFAITLILHFILLTYSLSHTDLGLDSMKDAAEITKSELVTQYDTIATTLLSTADTLQIDSLRRALFGNARHVDQDTMFSGINIFDNIRDFGILKKDAFSMSQKELNEKYEITSWWDKLFVRQTIRINKNRESTLAFIIGNLTWVVILVIFFIAALMKLIYVRGDYYYVEHAVLMMLIHAKTFLVLNVVLLLTIFLPDLKEDLFDIVNVAIYGIAVLYLFITMKIYYQQGWFKTFMKFLIVGVGYLISLTVFMAIVSLIGVALF